jgi:hypothetical protein
MYWLVSGLVVEVEGCGRSMGRVHDPVVLDLDILVGPFPYVQDVTTCEVKVVHEIIAIIG